MIPSLETATSFALSPSGFAAEIATIIVALITLYDRFIKSNDEVKRDAAIEPIAPLIV